MQTSAMDRAAETKTETQAGLAVAQGDSVALAALPCRRSSAGFTAPDSGLGGKRGVSILAIKRYHFGPGERSRWIDRSCFFSSTCGWRWTRAWGGGARRTSDGGPGDRRRPQSWYHFGIISHPGARGSGIDRRRARICTSGGRLSRIRGECQVPNRDVAILGRGRRSRAGFRLRNSAGGRTPRPSEFIPVVLVAQGCATNVQNEVVHRGRRLNIERGGTRTWRPAVEIAARSETRAEGWRHAVAIAAGSETRAEHHFIPPLDLSLEAAPVFTENERFRNSCRGGMSGGPGEPGGTRAMGVCEPGQGGNAAAINNTFMCLGEPPRFSRTSAAESEWCDRATLSTRPLGRTPPGPPF